MITTKYQQGSHEIKIESAESLEDAKNNGFPEGIYSRQYIDGKIVDNYMAMIRFITEEAKNNNSKLIPTEKDLMKTRNEMLKNQAIEMNKQLEELKAHYKQAGIPENVLEKVNDMIDKMNPIGVRIAE